MSKFVVQGGHRLKGQIRVPGNKNSALALIAAALLGNSPTTLSNVPKIRDMDVMADIARSVGVEVTNGRDGELIIDPKGLSSSKPDADLMGRVRASVVLAAPLLVRFGKVDLARPGGDTIGERLLDTHIAMLSAFGAKCNGDFSGYRIKVNKLRPGKIFLDEASVTATEMALMVGATMPEETVIEGAAAEPHIVDLCQMLIRMGAKIDGAGTNTVRIKGSKKLKGVKHKVRPDHIEVGTFAIAAAITGGDIFIKNVIKDDLRMTLSYLGKMGVDWEYIDEETLHIKPSELVAKQKTFKTRPWPGFPTDLMSPFIVLATQTKGTVLCHDWMYEWRIFFADHLISMGAEITIADPHRVIVSGPTKLHGEVIPSADIRAGGALVLAALAAEGESIIEHAEIIDRGYEAFGDKLSSLGAKITRVE
ncbi:UDP-N-acetylglucosamine 1-carboxyvinyltransferase [Candidatus Woesebacteria bacterium]|nr:UDP-N-acetylglucosamine 1-carboxyvinyltransferase [Candidatus Woesebacteria bacterium]